MDRQTDNNIKRKTERKELERWLSGAFVLAGGWDLISNTHMVAHNHLEFHFQGI